MLICGNKFHKEQRLLQTSSSKMNTTRRDICINHFGGVHNPVTREAQGGEGGDFSTYVVQDIIVDHFL